MSVAFAKGFKKSGYSGAMALLFDPPHPARPSNSGATIQAIRPRLIGPSYLP